ncbi:MAG TPA: heavy-metal-associated domain-containing protein [Flavobacterium sp.]|nr:heavy-metal-associated domain-containing protein [Flavobacterium sp.]
MNLKYLFTVLLFAIITIGTNAQNKNSGKAVIKTTIYCDHCKACETCGLNFRDNMLKIKGVKMYELDEENETITVYFNPKKTDLKTIKTAISKLGFDADDVKADPEAYEKLDNCCKPA